MVAAIEKAMGKPLNAIIPPEHADTKLPPLKMSNVGFEPGQTFSLLALHGPCGGVQVTGARWPLHDATLTGTEARGMSNEATDRTEVHVASGVLTVVVP